jgi:hypothetical protein
MENRKGLIISKTKSKEQLKFYFSFVRPHSLVTTHYFHFFPWPSQGRQYAYKSWKSAPVRGFIVTF